LIVHAALLQLGDAVQQPDLLLRVLRVGDHDLVGLDHPRPVVGGAVVRLERLGHVELLRLVGQQRLERSQSGRVGRVDGEGPVVGLDGLARLLELGQAQLAEAQVQVDLGLRVARQRQLPLEVLGQQGPLAAREVQAVEGNQRLHVLELVGEDLVVGSDRRFLLLEHLVLQVGDAEPQVLTPSRVAGQRHLAAVHAQQVGPVLVAVVELLEGVERGDVVGVDLDGLLVALDRLGAVAEALIVEGRELHQQVLLQLARQVAGDGLLVEGRKVGEAVLDVGDLLELGLGRLVVRVLLERAAVGVERGGGVADRLGLDPADLQQQLDTLAHGLGCGDLDLEGLDHLRPELQALVDRQQDGRRRSA
jgi:hypothetical protein